MADDLILRRQAGHPVPERDRDRFWAVIRRGEVVGAIVRESLAAGKTAWAWSIHLHAGRHGDGLIGLSGKADDLEAAMAAFRAAFDRAASHIGDGGWDHHVAHMAALAARR